MDYTILKDATKAHEIYPLMKFLHDLMESRKYSEVNDVLETAPLDQFSTTSLSCLVRTTCSMKRHLTSWKAGRDRVEKELVSRGEDAKQILRGLYSDRTPDCAAIHKILGLEAP